MRLVEPSSNGAGGGGGGGGLRSRSRRSSAARSGCSRAASAASRSVGPDASSAATRRAVRHDASCASTSASAPRSDAASPGCGYSGAASSTPSSSATARISASRAAASGHVGSTGWPRQRRTYRAHAARSSCCASALKRCRNCCDGRRASLALAHGAGEDVGERDGGHVGVVVGLLHNCAHTTAGWEQQCRRRLCEGDGFAARAPDRELNFFGAQPTVVTPAAPRARARSASRVL